MAEFHIKKGLDVPITGEPKQEISSGKSIDHVAIVAADFVGMVPLAKNFGTLELFRIHPAGSQ